MSKLLKTVFQSPWLRWKHRSLGLSVGILSVCDDVQFGLRNVVHNFVRLRSVALGDFSYVANGARVVNVNIGKFCSLGPNCRVGLGIHPTDHVSTHPAFYSKFQPPELSFAVAAFDESRTIEIGSDVWIGEGAMVMDGLRIGDGAVVGAGAVVTRDVPPYTIVAGVPARPLRLRFAEADVALLLATRWWDRDLAWIRANAEAFADPERFRKLLAGGAAQ